MNKLEVQKRVLQDGKPLNLKKFSWDENTNTFSSTEHRLVLDFNTSSDCTFKTGSDCTFKTSSYCTFKTGSDCTFKTGSYCTFKTSSYCTFKTSSYCTFNTGYNCTFKTGSDCTFKTSSDCTFNTGYNCTFNTSSDCTFNTGSDCIALFNSFRFFIDENTTYKTLNYSSEKGFILKKDNEDFFHYENETDNIVYIDNIISKVISKKGNVLKVINGNEAEESYIVSNNDIFSHGKTIKEAKESLIYKISNRNTDEYKDLTLDSLLNFKESVTMYRKITGSCESQTKVFAEANKFNEKKTIQELINLTKGQYNNNLLIEFFIK